MKNLKRATRLAFLATFSVFFTASAQNTTPDTNEVYLEGLLKERNPANDAAYIQRLKELASSGTEKNIELAASYYQRVNRLVAADSLGKISREKFPLGDRARNEDANKIFSAAGPAEKVRLYELWTSKFPRPAGPNQELLHDYVVSDIAQNYAKVNDKEKASVYIKKLIAPFWKGSGYAELAETFYRSGDLNTAAEFYKSGMESSKAYVDGKDSGESNSKFAASVYPGITMKYAQALYDLKRYEEALKYAELSTQNQTNTSASVNFQYAKILMALGKDQEAFSKLEAAVKSGKATAVMNDTFKELYIKVNGGEAGFEKRLSEIKQAINTSMMQKLSNSIISKKAPEFILTDIQGKKVSLSELKGKTVILDFWATWCGPCKASFPAMQMAVNKYKNDPSVQFLFIHTWENTATPTKDATDYIKSKQYNFEVLMDIKDPLTKVNKVVSDYEVSGIPTKFIIDGEGNIRFNVKGFDGSTESAVNEIAMMIEMVKSKRI